MEMSWSARWGLWGHSTVGERLIDLAKTALAWLGLLLVGIRRRGATSGWDRSRGSGESFLGS